MSSSNPWYSDATHAEYLKLLQLRREVVKELASALDKMAAVGALPGELHDVTNLAAACLHQEIIVLKNLEGEL